MPLKRGKSRKVISSGVRTEFGLPAAEMHIYLGNTTKRATVYSDPERTRAHTNPVRANMDHWPVSTEFPSVYLSPGEYRVVMVGAAGEMISSHPAEAVDLT